MKTVKMSAAVVVDSPTLVNDNSLDIDSFANEKLTHLIVSRIIKEKTINVVKRFDIIVNSYVYTAEMEITVNEEE